MELIWTEQFKVNTWIDLGIFHKYLYSESNQYGMALFKKIIAQNLNLQSLSQGNYVEIPE